MTLARRVDAHARLAAAALSSLPVTAWSHAFDDRYDLPAPLSYFVTGAAAAVGFSFVVAALFVRSAPSATAARGRVVSLGPLLPVLRAACRFVSLMLFVLTVVSGWFGTGDAMMNLAPTMIWIIWWVGLTLVAACIGNIWPVLDPWRTLFEMTDAVARRLGRRNGIVLGWTYPRAIGVWPAVILLLAMAWYEVIYSQAAVPFRLACTVLAWTALTLAGMACFGREAWQRNADVFAVYFATLGRFAPFAAGSDARSVVLRAPGRGLIAADAGSTAMVAFVIAMLSTVLFDGMLGGQAWWLIQSKLARAMPLLADGSGYIIGTIGLAGAWLAFLTAYLLTCLITASLVRDHPLKKIMFAFALTLVPIAIAYHIAHYHSTLLVQGQQVIALLSDPLGLKWDLFGTANFRPDIGIIDARVSWYVAIAAIVAGHVIAIWLAHSVALREFGAPRKAALASVPLTVLMVIYTAISLSIIAEPMVKFDMQSPQASGPGIAISLD